MAKKPKDPEARKIDEFVGARIQLARESARMTVRELAEKLGMGGKNPGHQVYLIENGRQGISLHRLWKIAEILGIEPYELIDPSVAFAAPGATAA